jgi:ankyrin repeat protein
MPKLDSLDSTDFLIQSWTQHLEHFLAIPTVGEIGLSDKIVQQILLEAALSVYTLSDKTSDKQSSTDASSQVGVELTFNDDGSLQAKTHPELRKGILGKTLAIINYYMQSFVHGGMYPRQVLEDWQHDKIIDLKAQATSVKCFLNDNFDDVEYSALPDLLRANKLLRISATQDEFASLDEAMAMSHAKFKTAFTLSIEGSVNIFDKALLLKPTPKVSTAIELSAEQKAYIKDYIAKHGAEPADYLLLVSLHQRVARSIEQHLEKLCPHEFAILQLAQLAVSYFQALKAEYKMPDLLPVIRSEDYSPVFTLPPLPVCQTRSLKITIIMGEVFKKIREFSGVKESLADYLMGKTLVLDEQVGERVPEVLDKILSGYAIKLSRRNIDRFSEFFLGYIHETQGKLQQLILDVVQEIQVNKLIDDVVFDATISDLLARQDVLRINELYKLIESQAKIAEPFQGKEIINQWHKQWTDCIAAAIGKMKSLFASCAPSCEQRYYFIVIDTQEVKLLDSSYHARFGDISRVSAKCVVTPMVMPDSTAYTDLSLATAIQEELTGNPAQTLRLVLSDGKKYAACTVKVVPQIIAHEAACDLLQERFLPSDASKFLAKSDVVQIQHLCTTGAEVDTADLSLFLDKIDDEGFSILHHISIFCTSTGLLDSLLRLSPKLLQLKDTNGYTPFHCAVAAGNMIAVNYFITYLADKLSDVINLGTYAGYTSLMLACMHGNTEMAQILLAAGSDPNILLPNGLYAAGLAILNKHIGTARVVLEYPATNVTLGSVNEESALHLALYNGQSNLACELMTRGAQVYERTDFGLSIACSKGLHTVIPIIYSLLETKRQELLQSLQGDRTRIEDALGKARRAERKSKGNPLGAILVVAANVVGAVCTSGSSIFMGGVGASLINLGSEVCRRGIGNTSGEIQASLDAMNREIDRVRSLALTHYPSGMGYASAIHVAAENGDLDVIKKLVELEPSNSSATGGAYHKTALMIALEHGQEEVVKFLAGITPIGVVNHHGENSALCAAKVGQWEISDLLIARGDDPSLRDKIGMNYVGVLIMKGDYARYSKLAARPDFDFGMRFTKNKKEYTSLEFAWLHGHPLLASYIRHQSKIKFEDKELSAALTLAIAADDLDFVLENKEKVIGPDFFAKYSCLAAENASTRCLREVFLPEVKTADASLILSALKSKNMDVIHSVLPKVEDINLELDDEANTAIHYAVKFGLSELVQVLIGLGASLLSKNKKEHTSYHFAIKRDDKEMLQKLLKIDTEDEFPDVLLAYAVQERSKECIKVLIANCKRLNLSKKYEKAQEVILEALTDVFYDLKLLEQLLKFVPAEQYQDTLVILLCFVIKQQKDEGLQFLLKLGANPLKVHAEDAQEEVSDVPDTALAFAVSGNYINALSVFVEHGYAEQMRALTTLAASPYTRKIINGQNAEINDSIRVLLTGLAKRDVDAVKSVLIDFPVNTFLFNNPHKPMGVKSPFLHHLFTLPFVADESEDDYFKFISAVLAPMLTSIDPLISDSDGNGLIRAIYFYSSLDSSARRQRNLKLIEKYFPDSKLAILTQPDGLGATLIENVTQDGMLELVSAGYPLDPPDGHPLLVRAVRRGYRKATEKILELGQSVDCCSPCGTTPLMVAAKEGHRLVEYLLETAGANPNLRDYKGNTALYYALYKKDIRNVLSLLYYTDEVLTANHLGMTHLMKALQADMPFVARALSYQMTDFFHRDRKGFGLMHYAADGDSIQGMQLLIEQGADIDELSGRDLTIEDKFTTARPTAPISHAASLGNAKMFVDLVKQGASLDKLLSAAISPLEYVKLKNQTMWQMLRQFPQFYDEDMRTAWLIIAARDNVLPILQELLLSGVPVSSYIENGNTALHLACERNSFEAAAMLLQLGASVDQANSDGNTPLHMAVSGNAIKLIILMAGVGVNPDLQNSLGETALYTASSAGNTAAVSALIKIGADMSLAAINGMTPAQIALHNGHWEVATILTIFGDNSLFEDATQLVTLKVDYSGKAAELIEKLKKVNLEAVAEDRTPLHKAVMLDNTNAVVMICDLIPDLLLLADKSGLTPVQLAMSLDKKRNGGTVKILREA